MSVSPSQLAKAELVQALTIDAAAEAQRDSYEPEEALDHRDEDENASVSAASITSPQAVEASLLPTSCTKGKTTADGATRKRVYRACEVCRRKKVKCNGENPCSHCIAFFEECHYADTKDRTAYSRRYVESLEHRLAKMEQAFLLATEDQRSKINTLFNAPPRRSRANSSSHQTTGNQERESPAREEESAYSLVTTQRRHYSGALKPDENHNLRYIGPSSAVALIAEASEAIGSAAGRKIEKATARPAHQDLPWFGSNLGVSTAKLRLSDPAAKLPPRDLCSSLVDEFFRRIHPIFPVLCESVFKDHFEQLFASNLPSQEVDAAFLSVVFAVLACGERARQPIEQTIIREYDAFRSDGYSTGYGQGPSKASWAQKGAEYYTRSHSLSVRCMTEARLEMVQLHALQAFYMAASNCTARAWILTGQAMRLALDLGLQRNLDHDNLNAAERETRKRVWWCVYMQDRLLGINIGRPFGVEDDNIDAQLPRADQGTFVPLMTGFAALISLSRTAGRIARTVARLHQARNQGDEDEEATLMDSARAHEAALDAWFESLPAVLKADHKESEDSLAIQSCIAFSCLHSTRMLLQQALLRDPTSMQSFAVTEQEKMDLAKCTQTALHMIRTAPKVAKLIPPSPYLLEFSHQLLNSGGFLAINAAKRKGANTMQLLSGAEEAINGFRHLERTYMGAKDHRKALTSVVKMVRERLNAVGRASTFNDILASMQANLGKESKIETSNATKRQQGEGLDTQAAKRRRSTLSALKNQSSPRGASPVTYTTFLDDWNSAIDNSSSVLDSVAPSRFAEEVEELGLLDNTFDTPRTVARRFTDSYPGGISPQRSLSEGSVLPSDDASQQQQLLNLMLGLAPQDTSFI